MELIGILIVGIIVGIVIGKLLGRSATQAAQSELASTRVRLEEREAELARLATQLDERSKQASDLQERVTNLSGELRAQEEKSARIVQLETLGNEQHERIRKLSEQNAQLATALEAERKNLEEQHKLLTEAQARLQDAFKALASEALSQNNKSFLELAKENLSKEQEVAKSELEKSRQAIGEMVTPLGKRLEQYDEHIRALEKDRKEAYGALNEQVRSLGETQKSLELETRNLVGALRKPQVRGRWGEFTLRRVVELAGMVERCDFDEQSSTNTDEGRLRPDLIVQLPGGRQIVVDAKTPLSGYLDALESKDENERQTHLQRHAQHLATHMQQLSAKSYWQHFDPTPDFVVMFIPAENFLNAALDQRPDLMEKGFEQKVILATPSTLISLLRTVALGWRQEQLARSAEQISELGQQIYVRLATMSEHLVGLGKSLQGSVKHYNNTIGSLERNVLSAARKFPTLGVAIKKELADPEPLDVSTREIEAPELKRDVENET